MLCEKRKCVYIQAWVHNRSSSLQYCGTAGKHWQNGEKGNLENACYWDDIVDNRIVCSKLNQVVVL